MPMVDSSSTRSAVRVAARLRWLLIHAPSRSSRCSWSCAGTYTEMTSRLAEPVLLGLAVLAVRSRVKR